VTLGGGTDVTQPKKPDQWHMKDLFALAVQRGASDLHLKAGQPPVLRIQGDILFTEFATLGAGEVLNLAMELMDDRLRRQFEEAGSADFSAPVDTGDRFRVNVYRQRGYTSLAARRVVRVIPGFRDLHLPDAVMKRVCDAAQGLVVFAGITGSGKSTSIAACLDHINHQRRCHIVTIENPIEFLFEDALAFINQREIGTDVPTFDLALKYLMREDPDVVLVGEMRDHDTCESVLRASETGHLVFTTLHASSCPGAITRLLDLFEPAEHPVIRQTLASNLVAVICQKLVPGARPEARLLPALEIMLASPAVRQAIREGEERRLADLIVGGADAGMVDFTQDLARLVREEWVDPKVAFEVAPNPELLKMALRGIDVKQGTLR
jgi:twitching motility protein PilT